MTSLIAKASLATLISFGALTGVASTASAGGWDAGVIIDVGPGRHHDDYGRPRYHDDYGYRGQCSPWMAEEKARWQGMRRAHVTHVGRYKVVVEGRRDWRYDRIVFANARGCPVLYR